MSWVYPLLCIWPDLLCNWNTCYTFFYLFCGHSWIFLHHVDGFCLDIITVKVFFIKSKEKIQTFRSVCLKIGAVLCLFQEAAVILFYWKPQNCYLLTWSIQKSLLMAKFILFACKHVCIWTLHHSLHQTLQSAILKIWHEWL